MLRERMISLLYSNMTPKLPKVSKLVKVCESQELIRQQLPIIILCMINHLKCSRLTLTITKTRA
jgi:hypothetical protein